MPRAFITGITGQDGQHLAQFLHDQGYDVFGMVKGQSNPRIATVLDEMPFIEMVPGDLADLPSLVKAIEFSQPDEVYNLGAISFVALSFNQAELTAAEPAGEAVQTYVADTCDLELNPASTTTP